MSGPENSKRRGAQCSNARSPKSWSRGTAFAFAVPALVVLCSGCDGTEGALLSFGVRDDPSVIRPDSGPPPPPLPTVDAGGRRDGGTPSPPVDGGALDGCVPATCAERLAVCGTPSDGCLANLDCGSCDDGFICNPDYQCVPDDECAAAQSGALICDGFETDGTYTVQTRDGTATLVTSPAFEGSQAFEASTTAGNGHARGRYNIPALTSGSLHFRTYLRVEAGIVSDIVKIFAFEADPVSAHVDIVLEDDDSVGVFFQETATSFQSPAGSLPTDTWVCLQGELVISDTEGGARLWLDSEPMVETDFIFDTLPDTGIETVFFGIHWTGLNENLATVYLDSLVIDTAPIDCLGL